jgi:hypothetical protein
MRRLLAASVATPALLLAAAAWAQPYDLPSYPQQGYDQSDDQGYDSDDGDYAAAPAEPDYGEPYGGPDDDSMDRDMASGGYGAAPDGQDYNPYAGGDYPEDYRAPGDEGAPQYPPYERVPPRPQAYQPAPQRYSSAPPQAMTPPLPQGDAGVPSDLVAREDRLEQRIRAGGDRGIVPPFHVDNLMVQLDSIRAQQDQLAQRDGGLDHTTRTFIESRLDRLERNVTW